MMIADYKVYEPETKEKILVSLGLFLGMTAVGYIFYEIFFFGIFLLPFYSKLIQIYCVHRAEQRRHNLLLQFRDFLYSLSSSFATGRHLTEAMEEAQENLLEIYGEEGEMVLETAYMLRCISETGKSELSVLSDFALRTGLEDVRDFIQVYGACRDTGGNLIAAVNKAAAVIGDKIGIEADIRAMVSQKKLEGKIILAMPIMVILFLQVVSPDYLEIMYQTMAGRCLMSLALLAILAAHTMIERITQIEI